MIYMPLHAFFLKFYAKVDMMFHDSPHNFENYVFNITLFSRIMFDITLSSRIIFDIPLFSRIMFDIPIMPTLNLYAYLMNIYLSRKTKKCFFFTCDKKIIETQTNRFKHFLIFFPFKNDNTHINNLSL